MSYPTRNGEVDETRGLGQVQFLLYRRAGTRHGWDGHRFVDMKDQPLGVQFGFQYGVQPKDFGVTVDDRATSAEQLMAKLAKGRVGLVLMQPEQAQQVLSRMPGHRIEALEPVFSVQTFFVIVTRAFEQRNPELTQRLWKSNAAWRAGDDP